jgi:hypothetical protein
MRVASSLLGVATCSLVAALCSLTTEARAETEQPLPPQQAPADHWYGYQPLVADGAALTVAVSGIAVKSGPVFATGFAPALLAPPILHFVHANIGFGLASLAIRACVPVTLGTVGLLATYGNWNPDINAFYAGFLVGWGVASALDAAVFSWEKVKPPERSGSSFTWQPNVGLGRGGGTVGVAGTF